MNIANPIKSILFPIAAVALVGAIAAVAYMVYQDKKGTNGIAGNTEFVPGQPVERRGTVGCLPKNDASGVQTLECAYGLLVGGEGWYGLSDVPQDVAISSFGDTGQSVLVTGTAQAADENSQYVTAGTIKVSGIEE